MREDEMEAIVQEVMKRLKTEGIRGTVSKEQAENLLRAYPEMCVSSLPAERRAAARIKAFLARNAADPYIQAVELFYFDGLTNAQVAAKLYCDDTTCRRNRSRLVRAFAAELEDGKTE